MASKLSKSLSTQETTRLLFGFDQPEDWLAMCNREIDRFKKANKMEFRRDHALTACIALWHMADWVWHVLIEPSPSLKRRCGGSSGEFEKRLRMVPPLDIIYALAHAAKHRRLKAHAIEMETVTSTGKVKLRLGADSPFTITPMPETDDYDVMIPTPENEAEIKTANLKVVTVRGRERALRVLCDAMRFWNEFCSGVRQGEILGIDALGKIKRPR